MEFYIDEKQRKKCRRILKIKIYGGIAVFLLFLGGLFYGVVYSPLFQIKQINIRTSDAQNINVNTGTSDVQTLVNEIKSFFFSRSGFFKFFGKNNILIWNNNVADFLEQRPDIASLSIKKNYFNRTVTVDFQKREKFGVWCQENCWWFDKDGVIFERAPKTEGEMIYKVNDLSDRRLAVGEKVLEKYLLGNLLKIFDVLERADLSVRTLQIKDLSLQEAVIESNNLSIPMIYFSLRFDPEFSLAAFRNLKKTGLEKIEYIDLRVENRAYYKIR